MTMASSYNLFVTAQGSIAALGRAISLDQFHRVFNIHTTIFGSGEIRANMKPDAVFADGFEQVAG
jgi:hypothetical protein